MNDERIDRALAAWLDQRAEGRTPSIDEFVRQYPDIADELRELLGTMAELDAMQGSAPTSRSVRVGERDYRIERLLGRGGMGEVHLATDRTTGERVAIKVLTAPFARDPERRARFEREAALGGALRHPSIVAVHGRGEWHGLPCLVMDFVPGSDLAQLLGRLRQHPARNLHDCDLGAEVTAALAELELVGAPGEDVDDDDVAGDDANADSGDRAGNRLVAPSRSALHGADAGGTSLGYYGAVAQIAAELAEALHYAHEAGVCHRDVKPQNILLDEQLHPRLLDFGLATARDDASLSRSGDQIGTLHYMSPEMVQHGATRVDHRTDVYSLGVTLFELLTLSLPFAGVSSPALMRSIERDPTPWPRRRNPDVPPDLQGIVLKALAKKPEHRYATAAAMAEDLRRYLRFERVQARTPGPWGRTLAFAGRHRRVLLIAAGLAAFVLGSTTVSAYERASEYERLIASATKRLADGETFAALPDLVRANELRPSRDLSYRIGRLKGDRTLSLRGLPPEAEVVVTRLPTKASETAYVVHRAKPSLLEIELLHGDYLLRIDGGADAIGERFFTIDDADPLVLEPTLVPRTSMLDGMVEIPAGTYLVGNVPSAKPEDDCFQIPEQRVAVAAFAIDRCEVSNAQYAAFCRATGHRRPSTWGDGDLPPELAKKPVASVSFDDACAYAAWVGKRLPTSTEWEVALRGIDGRRLPWGDALEVDVALGRPVPTEPLRHKSTRTGLRDVDDAGDDRSPFGALHMIGNVSEWTLDLFFWPTEGNARTTFFERTVRGGSYESPLVSTVGLTRVPQIPNRRSHNRGFRCAITLP